MRKWKFDPPYTPPVPEVLGLQGPSEDSLVFIDHRFKMMMARTEDGHPLGEVAAESTDEDVYYLSPVYIGEGDKKQLVMLDFDTGSADLWGTIPLLLIQRNWLMGLVFTKKALGKRVDSTHHFYDPTISPTMKPLEPKSTFRIDYADGSWAKGNVVLVYHLSSKCIGIYH
jgi:hypothetical protein